MLKRRIVMLEPLSESGSMIALTREPSGRARIDHRRRFVDAPSERRDDPFDNGAQMTLVLEGSIGQHDFAATLDVNHVGTVHHDFRDAFVAHEIFEGTEAELLVDYLLLQVGALFQV